jgi:hypothetical protein
MQIGERMFSNGRMSLEACQALAGMYMLIFNPV